MHIRWVHEDIKYIGDHRLFVKAWLAYRHLGLEYMIVAHDD